MVHAVPSSCNSARPSPLSIPGLDNPYGRVFCQFDADQDGRISPAELRAWACTAAGQDLTEEDAVAMVQAADSDGDGFLGFEEFVRLVSGEDHVEGNDEEDEKEKGLMEAFSVYVESERGCITPSSLRRALCSLGESSWGVDQCRGMIDRYDQNGDGMLSFQEFRAMMLTA